MDVNEATRRAIDAALIEAATSAGIVDLDAIKMLDTSGVKVNAAGAVEGAKELMDRAKGAKPHLFKAEKHARDMTDAEYVAARSRLTGYRPASGRR